MRKRESDMRASEMKPNSTRRHFIRKLEAIRASNGGADIGGRWGGSLESLYSTIEVERAAAEAAK